METTHQKVGESKTFPSIEQKPDVDNLIEIDKVELRCALGEIKGDPRDSIA